eukprot:2987909-Pleurochrysis_carterae.AAC.1
MQRERAGTQQRSEQEEAQRKSMFARNSAGWSARVEEGTERKSRAQMRGWPTNTGAEATKTARCVR